MTRDKAVGIVAPASGAAVAVSLVVALIVRQHHHLQHPYGDLLLGFWALVPPVWFIYEWKLTASLPKDERDRIKHFHDLSRNLWIALIVALGLVMGVKYQ